MSTAYEYLKENPVFFIATVENGKGRVRPFGFIMKRNNALYMCTNNTKDVYKQMVASPDIEISAMGKDGTWLRVRGKVAFDASREAKAQVFVEMPDVLKIYPKGADDEIVITFYFVEAQATLFSFAQAPQTIALL